MQFYNLIGSQENSALFCMWFLEIRDIFLLRSSKPVRIFDKSTLVWLTYREGSVIRIEDWGNLKFLILGIAEPGLLGSKKLKSDTQISV